MQGIRRQSPLFTTANVAGCGVHVLPSHSLPFLSFIQTSSGLVQQLMQHILHHDLFYVSSLGSRTIQFSPAEQMTSAPLTQRRHFRPPPPLLLRPAVAVKDQRGNSIE